MSSDSNDKYNLEERTFQFAKMVCLYVNKLPRTISNIEYSRQVIRSSASVGANYREANESLGKKDFKMRIKISRKEAKESEYFLRLIVETNDVQFQTEGLLLVDEACQLKRIFSPILLKTE
ncbi:MAG: four helix bundle protein [bacterium]